MTWKTPMLRGVIAFIMPVLTAAPAGGQEITGVEGDMVHGGEITIVGSGFGAKEPAAPLYWDDMEGGKTLNNPATVESEGGFSEVFGDTSEECGDFRMMYRDESSLRWPGAPHPYSRVILGGGHKDTFSAGNTTCRSVLVTVAAAQPAKEWFVLYYKRFSEDWPELDQGNANWEITLAEDIDAAQTAVTLLGDYGVVGAGDVFMIDEEKMLVNSRSDGSVEVTRGHLGTAPATHAGGSSVYVRCELYNLKVGAINPETLAWGHPAHWQIYGLLDEDHDGDYHFTPLGGGGGCLPCGCTETSECYLPPGEVGVGCDWHWGGTTGVVGEEEIADADDIRREWKHLEVRYHDGPAPGWTRSLVDNAVSTDCGCVGSDDETYVPYDFQSWSFGTYFRYCYPEGTSTGPYHQHDDAWLYLDDIYADNTFSRVILTDSAVYESAAVVEPQIPSVWSDGSITARVNLGKLPGCSTAYLFVFNAADEHNAEGVAVEIPCGPGEEPGTEPAVEAAEEGTEPPPDAAVEGSDAPADAGLDPAADPADNGGGGCGCTVIR